MLANARLGTQGMTCRETASITASVTAARSG
jgi:hypothetical protein